MKMNIESPVKAVWLFICLETQQKLQMSGRAWGYKNFIF